MTRQGWGPADEELGMLSRGADIPMSLFGGEAYTRHAPVLSPGQPAPSGQDVCCKLQMEPGAAHTTSIQYMTLAPQNKRSTVERCSSESAQVLPMPRPGPLPPRILFTSVQDTPL